MNKVTVTTHPVTGEVITASKNKPEFGTIRVEESGLKITNGFANMKKRSAFIRGKIVDLKGLRAGQQLDGKIVAKESFEPWFKDQTPKINPTTSEVISVGGKAVYLTYEYTENAADADQLIKAEVAAPVKRALAV